MKAEKRFKKNKSIFPLFISLIIILSFTIFVSIYVITNNSLNEQNLNENSNPIKLGNLLQNQNINPSLDLDDLIFYHTSHSTSSNSKSSGSSSSSDDVNEEINLGNPTEDSTTNLNTEEPETNSTDNSDSVDNIQTSGDKKTKLIDDENDGFINVIVMLKDDEVSDEMLGIAIDSPVEKKLSIIKSKVKTKQDKVLSTLDSSEFLIKHKYKTVSGFAGKITQEGWDKLEQDPNVESIYEDGLFYTTLTQSVPLINADDIHDLGITGEGTVVCVIDTGIDYTHPDLGNCVDVYDIDGNIVLDNSSESPHPYGNNYSETWTITKPGFSQIAVHFSYIDVEYNYDGILIKDANDNIVQILTGKHTNMWSVSVPGDTIKINFVTDYSVTKWGFAIDKVLNGTATFLDNPLQDCEKVIDGWDFVNNDNDPMDDNSHGTHVAGIVAANGTLKGVAPGAKLIAVKVLNYRGSGSFSDVAAGIDWCNVKKADYNIVATTMSLSTSPLLGPFNSTYCPNWIDNSIDAAHSLGIAVTAASGNYGWSNGISYPACSPNAISVGSTTKWDVISSFTNTGELLDLLAPGSSIYSTVLNGGYAPKSGTSMATPFVAGAIALAKQFLPTASPDEIEEALKNTGVPITDPDNNLSFSRIDLLAALMNVSECSSDSDCDDSNPYTKDICNNPGTTESYCSYLPIACLIDLDCGTDGYVGEPSCQDNDSWQDYTTYTCNDQATPDSYCSNSTTPKLKQDCGVDEYSNNYCYDNDVYRDFIDRGCSSGSCFETATGQLVQECEYGCTEGRCLVEVCETICNFGKCYEYCVWE